MKYLVSALLVIFLMGSLGMAFAADIVSVPTANLVKAGEVDVAGYYFFLDFDEPMPEFVRVQTLYVGLTDRLELDIHRYDVDTAPAAATLLILNYKILKEQQEGIDLVFGAKDLADRADNPAVPRKNSYYLSAAKTINPPAPGTAPNFPIVRLHLSVGTEDPSLLGELDRHEGVFGGVQALVTPKVGVVALYDTEDLITGVTYTHDPKWPTVKAGTFGDHIWVGINYTFNMK